MQSLAIAGVAASVATQQYGILNGYAFPLLSLPAFITYALSTALVPSISEAMAKRQHKLVEHRLQQGSSDFIDYWWMVSRYIIRICFTCFNSYVWIG